MLAVLRLHKVPISPGRVAIADHDVGGDKFAAGQLHALGTTAFDAYAGNRCVVANRNIARLQQIDQFTHDSARTTHGRMHAPAPLECMDERVHASDRIRIAADEQWMKAHDDTQLGVLDVLRDQAVNRTPGLHARQVGHGFDHIAQGLKRNHA